MIKCKKIFRSIGEILVYQLEDDSLMLHNDLYQINMAESYWNDNIHEKMAVFDLYFRKMPFNSGYAVFNGLKRVIDFIEHFGFSESDLEYLKSIGYKDDFLSYLKDLKFTGSIRSMQEGELCFGNEPLLRVEAPLIQAQLIETILLNIVNFHTLITTKASRIRQIASNDKLMEFGTRRAQEIDAALWGARAAYMGALILQVMLGRVNYLVYLCLVHMHTHLSKLMEMNMLPSKNMLKDIKIVCS